MDEVNEVFQEEDATLLDVEGDMEEQFVLVRIDGTWLAEVALARRGIKVVPATITSEIADATDEASGRR